MNNEEAKKAMLERTPVYYENLVFKKINALIFRQYGESIRAFVELQDKKADSIFVVPVSKIELNESEIKSKLLIPVEIEQRLLQVEDSIADMISTVYSERYDRIIEKLYKALEEMLRLEKDITPVIDAIISKEEMQEETKPEKK